MNAVQTADEAIPDDEFYGRCAALLGTVYDCQPFTGHQRTRWNNRQPGGGRSPGHGIIRLFGEQVHISLRHPVTLSAVVEGRRQALGLLEETLGSRTR